MTQKRVSRNATTTRINCTLSKGCQGVVDGLFSFSCRHV